MASIYDVAQRAGVSVSTVSKVLNNYKNISQATRDKVNRAAKELNYVPNAIASALSSKNGKRIGVVVFINNKRQAIDEINMQYLFGTFEQAKKQGLEVVTIFSTVFNSMSKDEIIQYLNSLRIQTIIVYGLHKEESRFSEIIEDEHFKMVVVDAPILNESTSYVMVDHRQAQYEIAQEMIMEQETPVSDVLYLAGRRDGYVTDLRLQGIGEICDELGVTLHTHYADFSEKRAIDLTKEHAHGVDLIVAASDLMAIGAVGALKEMNLFRPVCGYDGIKLLGYVGFKMKTVYQDFYEIARTAVDEAKRLWSDEKGRAVIMDYKITEIKYEDVII